MKNVLLNASVILSLITLFYGYMYSTMKDDFGFTDDPIDPYYFSLLTMSTVGYGDFSPKTRRAKILVMSQHILLLIEIVVIVKSMFK